MLKTYQLNVQEKGSCELRPEDATTSLTFFCSFGQGYLIFIRELSGNFEK